MIPDFLRRPDPEHPMAHNLAAVALRTAVRMGYAREDTEPLLLNWGFGMRVFTVEAALDWAERWASEELA